MLSNDRRGFSSFSTLSAACHAARSSSLSAGAGSISGSMLKSVMIANDVASGGQLGRPDKVVKWQVRCLHTTQAIGG